MCLIFKEPIPSLLYISALYLCYSSALFYEEDVFCSIMEVLSINSKYLDGNTDWKFEVP